MKINHRELKIVKPLSPTQPGTVISLSSIDQIVPRLYTRFLLFFNKGLPSCARLQSSLSSTLAIFYPLAGRYRELPNKGLEIHCTDEGANFHEAWLDSSLEEFHGFDCHDPRFEILVSYRQSSRDITELPLLEVQVSHFNCGGASLALGVHHNAADGHSASQFLKVWADICSSPTPTDSVIPSFRHILLQGSRNKVPLYQHIEYQTYVSSIIRRAPESKVAMFEFTRKQLHSLRSFCEPGTTRFEALAGHIWKHVTTVRDLKAEEETRFGTSVDGRRRWDPALPETYFGNAIFYACAASRVEDIVTRPSSYAASRVREAVSRINFEYMTSALDWIEQHESPVDVYPAFCDATTDLPVTSWVRFPLYEADFGSGKPVFVGVPVGAFSGLVILMPSRTSADNITALIGLDKEHIDKLLASPEFCTSSL